MKRCRCCANIITEKPSLSYKNMPGKAQNFPDINTVSDDKGMDIDVYQCPFCGLIQILQEPVYYYKDVIRAVAVSEDMREFRKDYFKSFVAECQLQGKKIIEIGAGSGEYMEMMAQNNVRVYGLEHLHQSVEKAKSRGLQIFEGFVEDADYKIPEAPYDGFYIMNFLEHIPLPREFMKGIAANLKREAYGIVEVPNGDFIIRNQMFSEFMLDHLAYFTKETLTLLLESSGFEIKSCQVIWKDYIISAIVKKRNKFDANSFIVKQDNLVRAINDFLDDMKKNGKKVAVWGAGHQALATIAMAEMQDKIECVIDSANFKQNKYTPATHIPIYAPDKIDELDIGVILVMAGSYSDEVCRMIRTKYENIVIKTIVFEEE